MAPTICSEKDYRSRRNRLKDSRQYVSSDTGQKLSLVNSNFGGRITHRRTISNRNAGSFKLSSSNIIENDRNKNNSITTNESHESYLHSSSSNESAVSFSSISSSSSSSSSISSSPSYQKLDGNTSDLIYCDRLSYLTPPIIQQQSINKISNEINVDINLQNDNTKNYSNDDDKSFSNEDNEVKMILQQKIPQKNCYYSDAVKCTSNKYQLYEQQRQQQRKRQNTKGLVEIAMKTITLIRRNQMLQRKLLQLQLETKNFIQSVMSNPENQTFTNKQNVAVNETNNNLKNSIDQE